MDKDRSKPQFTILVSLSIFQIPTSGWTKIVCSFAISQPFSNPQTPERLGKDWRIHFGEWVGKAQFLQSFHVDDDVQVSVSSLVLLSVLGVGTSFAMACAFVRQPTIFKYPALLCSMSTLGIKLIAIFVHTPEMKEFSLKTSTAECNHESSIQLLLLLHIWLSGGELYLGAIVSSNLVIGKVGSENFLMKGEVNQLEEKSFLEKVLLIMRYTPVMALISVFRIGGATIAFYHPSFLLPLSPVLALFLTWAYLALNIPLLLIVFTLLKPWSSSLRKLSPLDLATGIMGEFVTVRILL